MSLPTGLPGGLSGGLSGGVSTGGAGVPTVTRPRLPSFGASVPPPPPGVPRPGMPVGHGAFGPHGPHDVPPGGGGAPAAPGTRPFSALVLVDVTLVAILAVLAIAPFRELFISSRVIVLALGAVVMCLVVNTVLRKLATSWLVLIGLVTIAVYIVFAVFRVGFDDAVRLRDVWSDVSGSWADLLTATVPTGTSPGLASLPVLLAWTAAECGLVLARTRSACAPIVPPLVAFAVTLLFTGAQGVASPIIVAGLLVVSLLVVLLRANLLVADRSSSGPVGSGFGMDVTGKSLPIGQLRLGAVVVAVVTAGAVAAAAISPITNERDRADLHDRYEPPLDVTDALSPLAAIRPLLNDPSPTALFTVEFGSVPEDFTIERVRAVVLDTYDGTVWSTGATFARAGTELPDDDSSEAETIEVAQRYVLADGYESSFLPALDRPASATGGSFGFDRTSGMLIASAADRRGLSYDVTSRVPIITDLMKHSARPGNDPEFSRLSLAPSGKWPTGILQFAQQFPTEADRFETLEAIQAELLSDRFGYDTESRPGHSLGVLEDFLTASVGDAEAGVTTARIGYEEQFAAAFAVLARVKGMPSRVVVGYDVDNGAVHAGTPIPVLPSDITAWAEVHLNGVGWVTFDPTNPTPREPETPPSTVPETTQAPEDSTPDSAPPESTSPSATTVPQTGSGRRSSDDGGVPIGLFVALGVVLLAPASIPLTKAVVRRKRRTRGPAAARTLGAWAEARDGMRAHGVHVTRSATVAESAEIVEPVDPALAAGLLELKPLVDTALYAQAPPDDDLAGAAWAAQTRVGKQLATRSTLKGRVKAAFDPRPIVDNIRHR